MLRKFIRAGVVAGLGMAMMMFAYEAASATPQDKKDEKVPSIIEIMTKGHDGPQAYISKIKTAAKAEKWDDAKTLASKFKELGEAITKCDPPKGDKDSWAKMTKKYKDDTIAVADAVEKKDAKAVSTATAVFNKSCKACHDAHKE